LYLLQLQGKAIHREGLFDPEYEVNNLLKRREKFDQHTALRSYKINTLATPLRELQITRLWESVTQQWAWWNRRENHEWYPDNFTFPPKPPVILGAALSFI